MAARLTTSTDQGLRCPVHHCDARLCESPAADLAETLADLDSAGIPTVSIPPRLLDLCDAFSDCTEQAEVLIRTTGPERRDATFTVWHACCSGCLWRAVSADLRSGYRVEIHVPTNAAAVTV